MSHGIRDGDIISTSNPKFGALTMSTDLAAYPSTGFSPEAMWAGQPAVRTVVDFIVDSMALLPFDVYRRTDGGGREKARDHELQHALHRPGRRLGQRRWIAQLQRDMMLYGRWAVAILDDTGARGPELLRIPAHAISFTVDSFGRYQEVVVHLEGKRLTRPVEDFIFDINDAGRLGQSDRAGTTPISVLEGLAIETDALNAYRTDLFRNAAMMPTVIERPADAGKWSDDAWRRFKESFSTYKAGGGNRGGTPILEDGMKLKSVETFNPRDAEVLETRRMALVEAAQALRVPPELVGAKDGTHSNIVALREQLYVDVLGSHIGYFEDALNVGLAERLGDDTYIEANLEARLRATFTERVKAYQAAGGGPWLTRAEIRNRENLPHLEDTDELIVPLNVVSGGLASPLDTGQTNEPDDELKATPLGLRSRTKAKTPAPPARARAGELREQTIDGIATFIAQLRTEWLRELGIQDDRKAIAGVTPLRTISPAIVARDKYRLASEILPEISKLAAASSKDVLTEIGATDWSVWSAGKQTEWLSRAADSWAEAMIEGRFLATVNDAIAEHPETWGEVLQRHLATPSGTIDYARNVAGQAEHFGRFDAAKAAGADSKTWLVRSGNPRDSHAALDGLTIPLAEDFPNGLPWPHAPGPPEETQGCQCTLLYTRTDG